MGIALLNSLFPHSAVSSADPRIGFDLQGNLELAVLYEMHAYEHDLAWRKPQRLMKTCFSCINERHEMRESLLSIWVRRRPMPPERRSCY
jgi:hypothetical protein